MSEYCLAPLHLLFELLPQLSDFIVCVFEGLEQLLSLWVVGVLDFRNAPVKILYSDWVQVAAVISKATVSSHEVFAYFAFWAGCALCEVDGRLVLLLEVQVLVTFANGEGLVTVGATQLLHIGRVSTLDFTHGVGQQQLTRS